LDELDSKSILVVQIGKIGDMVLTTPLFSQLKELYPGSKLTVLASSLNKDIPLNHSSVDEVKTFKKDLLSNILLLNSSLKKTDLWIDTKDNYSRTSEIFLKIFKPERSLGFNHEKKIFDISLKDYMSGKHAVDINLSAVNYLKGSVEKTNARPSFDIPADVQRKVDSVLRSSPYAKKILLNISAGDKSRYLQTGKWIDIINRIYQSNLYCFYLIGMDRDMESIDIILSQTKGLNTRFIRTRRILEASEVIRKCDAAITADTSIVHICSAFNVPVVALYPNVKWNLEKFAPLSDIQEIVVSSGPGSIDDISVDTIVEKFRTLAGSV
jgi:ADP-heptose:LPS heptosyltransferase